MRAVKGDAGHRMTGVLHLMGSGSVGVECTIVGWK